MATDFERLGGEPALRAIVDDFVGRVFDDVMIGFLFHGRSRERLREMEYQLAAEELGGPVRYAGRPLREAHAPLPILGGHFLRRRKILADTLRDHGVPEDVAARWLERTDAQKDQVLGPGVPPTECDHDLQAARIPRRKETRR